MGSNVDPIPIHAKARLAVALPHIEGGMEATSCTPQVCTMFSFYSISSEAQKPEPILAGQKVDSGFFFPTFCVSVYL